MKILFKNANILDLDNEQNFILGCVVVEKDLIIEVTTQTPNENDFDKVIDCEQNILMPGFVNAHTHSAMTLFRGLKDDVTLQEWLFDNMIPLEAQLKDNDVYWGTMLAIAEQVRGGITSMLEMYYRSDETSRAAHAAGFRAFIGMSVDASQHGNTSIKTEDMLNFEYNRIRSQDGLVLPRINSHSIYTQSPNMLEAAVNYAAKQHCPLSIHLSETLTEVGECLTEHGMTPPQYLEQLGFLDRQCTIFHGVHLDKDDISLLASYDVSVVSCPSSNLKLGSGIAPLFALKNANVNIALGTDGAASNNSLDMFKEMFLAATLQKAVLNDAKVISAKDVVAMATINGAKAVGSDEIGEIKKGKKADIILISTQGLHWHPKNNLLNHLVYSAKSSDVYMSMINGKIVYENGKFDIGESIETIQTNCSQIVQRLKADANL